jgi:putative membrane protein
VKQTTAARALAAVTALAGLAVAALAAGAQTPPPGAPPMGAMSAPRDRMPANDAEFVRALDAANTAELAMAKFLVNRTQDPAVHGFAQRMIDDHSTAAVKLEAATRGTNLAPVPRDVETNRRGEMAIARLQGEDGTQRDNDYMRMQVPAHQRVLALLQWESDNGTNAGLKILATNLIPTDQQHLEIAQNFLAAHNLTPYSPPPPGPVPGHVNPAGGVPGPGTPNNPASMPNGGSTTGEGNGTAGTVANPVVAPTYQPMGSGTPPANANGGASTPVPMASATPHP